MPAVKKGETRDDYMARCVPQVRAEGLDENAAVGKCEGMYDSHSKMSAAQRLRATFQRHRFEAMTNQVCDCGLNEGMGCADPESPACRLADKHDSEVEAAPSQTTVEMPPIEHGG